MLIDDDIRQIEQKQEANVAVLKNTNWKTKWTKSKVNILRLVVQSLSEYSSRIQELLLYWVMTQQVNELIKLCVSCSPSDKWTLFVNRGSRDGIDANGFHSIRVMVTRHSLTICQSKTNRVYFWCGYTDVVPWDSSSGRELDANAIVFSLTETERWHAV